MVYCNYDTNERRLRFLLIHSCLVLRDRFASQQLRQYQIILYIICGTFFQEDFLKITEYIGNQHKTHTYYTHTQKRILISTLKHIFPQRKKSPHIDSQRRSNSRSLETTQKYMRPGTNQLMVSRQSARDSNRK